MSVATSAGAKVEVCATLAIEYEVALAVRVDCYDCERRVSLARRQNAVGRHPIVCEGRDQQSTECLVADFAQHRRTAAETRDAHCDVARRAARFGNEARLAVRVQCRHEIDDELAERDDIKSSTQRHDHPGSLQPRDLPEAP